MKISSRKYKKLLDQKNKKKTISNGNRQIKSRNFQKHYRYLCDMLYIVDYGCIVATGADFDCVLIQI